MADDLGSFARRIQRRGRQVEVGVNRVARATALAVDRQLVLGTPVDTGRARSNWIVNLNSPARDTIEPYSPGEKGSTGTANVQAALAQGAAEIASRQPGQDIWISNNLEYIQSLNDGSSAQAPAGFVQLAVQEGVEVIRRQAQRLFDGN